jgi:hypothetical protein
MSEPQLPPARPTPSPKKLLGVAAVGSATAVLAYVIGRGTIIGMVAVFAVLGIGQRVWARWYRKRRDASL